MRRGGGQPPSWRPGKRLRVLKWWCRAVYDNCAKEILSSLGWYGLAAAGSRSLWTEPPNCPRDAARLAPNFR